MARKKIVKKNQRLRKDVWFVKVRGSYLPCSAEGRLLYLLLILMVAAVGFVVYLGRDMLIFYLICAGLEIAAIGYAFTLIAKKKS